jgi:hypothetical protein
MYHCQEPAMKIFSVHDVRPCGYDRLELKIPMAILGDLVP